MTIRDAQETDLPAIVAIYNAAIPGRMATADVEPVTVDSRRPWFHEHVPGRFPLWVAEDGKWIAGWLAFRMFYGRAAYAAAAEVSLYIAPEAQRQGVGRLLLSEAVRRAASLGLKTLLYFSFAHNTASCRLAETMGFQEWGCLPDIAELDGVPRSLVILGRKVGNDAH